MSTDLQVVLTARDTGVSRAMTTIGKDAKTAGDAIEAAGKEGAAGLQQIDRAAKEADAGLDALSAAAKAADASLDAVSASARTADAGLDAVNSSAKTVDASLDAVNASAKATGDALEQAGIEGSQGLQKVEQAARDADRSVDQVGKTAKKTGFDMEQVGFAALAVGAGLVYAGDAALQQQQTIIGLQAAYGDAAAEMIAFADQMAETSIFNDDDILAGERYFATLRTQYGLSIQQIQDLMRTTADLASASGTSFEDASSRVTAALRGEAEAAEYLGLTMNQQAIDRGNLTLTMSNQEAAQFRLAALNEQAAQFSGTAATLAESEVGARARLTNVIKDNAQALGQFIGPYTSIIAGAASGAVGLAQFAGGFGALAGGIRTATTVSRAFIASPLGLTITAIGGAVALATGLFQSHRSAAADAAAEWEAAEASAASLTDQINQMALAGNVAESNWADSFATSVNDQFVKAQEELAKLTDLGFHDTSWLDQYVTDVLLGQGQKMDGPNWLSNFTAVRDEMVDALMPTESDRTALNDAMTSLFELMLEPEVDGARVRDRMQEIFANFDPAMGIDSLIAEFVALEAETLSFISTLDTLTAGMSQAERAFEWMLDDLRFKGMGDLADDLQRINDLTVDLSGSTSLSADMQTQFANAQERLNGLVEDGVISGDKYSSFLSGQLGLLHRNMISYEEYALSIILAADNADQFVVSTDLARAALGRLGSTAGPIGRDLAGIGEGMNVAKDVFGAAAEEMLADMLAVKETIAARTAEIEEAPSTAFTGFLSNGDNILDFWLQFSQQAGTGAAGVAEVTTELDAAFQAVTDMRSVLDGEFLAVVGLADDLDDAGAALDDILATFGQIDSLGQRSSASGAIADALFGEDGDPYDSIGPLRELYETGRIGQTQFNDAASSGVSIQESNLRVQEDLNAMRATQLPLLASEQAAYEAQIDAISQLPALEQRRALALQDTNVQAQLATQYATAYQASIGEIPKEVATQMIVSAAEADPVIADLLTQMGLIEEGADGTISINFPDGPLVQETILGLTNSIDALIVTLGGVPPVRLTAEDEATPIVESLIGVLGQTDGSSANATITATDNATGVTRDAHGVIRSTDNVVGTGTVSAIDTASGTTRDAQGVIRSLTGKSVTITAVDNASGPANAAQRAINALSSRSVTLTTYYKTVGSPPAGMIGPSRLHGGMAEYALGGNVVPIWAGEGDRPEIAHFASGGSALIPREGMYHVPVGTYIEPSNSARSSIGGGITLNVTVLGDITTERRLTENTARAIFQALGDELDRRNVALGVA